MVPGSLLGNAVARLEDPELLVGEGRYAEDLEIAGVSHVVFVLNEACARPPLATGKVRFVGDMVAMVVAESRASGP